jgi:hypothetical protein
MMAIDDLATAGVDPAPETQPDIGMQQGSLRAAGDQAAAG